MTWVPAVAHRRSENEQTLQFLSTLPLRVGLSHQDPFCVTELSARGDAEARR